jgi:mannosyltransferase OCH1-like enzyme
MYHSKNKYFKNEIEEYIKDNGWIKTDSLNNKVFFDKDYYSKTECNDCLTVNQFKDINVIGNKKMQYQQFLKYHKIRADYIPETIPFIKSEVENLKHLFNGKIYILKPENGTFRSGITIVSTYSQLVEWINRYNENKWILQIFISNPLLFNNRKFHLRIYSILIRNKDTFEAYVYYNGFMYSSKDLYNNNDLLSHGSNLSGEDSPKQVNMFPQDFIDMYGKKKYNKIIPQINKIVKETIEASIDQLQCPNTKNPNYRCFKMIGYDLLVDDNFKVHMLEINARLVTFKYPPEGFKKLMYYDILNLVFKNNLQNFDKVLNIELKNYNTEHFGNIKEMLTQEQKFTKTSNLSYYIIALVALLVLSFLMKYLIIFVIILIGVILYKKYYLKQEDFSNQENKMIPKYIFQIWISEENKPVPEKYNNFMKSVNEINNNFQYKLYKKNDCEEFLKNEYPSYYKTYQKLPLLIQKIDFVRYVIAYHYGGFYLDLDIEVYKNFNPLRIYKNVFGIDSEIKENIKQKYFKNSNMKYLISNYAFGCVPKSKLMKNIIDGIHENINFIIKTKNDTNNYVYTTTGQIYITKIYDRYNKINKNNKDVMVLNYNDYQKFGDYAGHRFDGIWKKEIPKVIIQTYFDKSKIPQKVYDNIKKYAPNYKHIIYDDKECIDFIQKNYGEKYVKKFNSLKRGAHKADLFRYCYLYKNGGIYLDIKTELIRSMDSIIKNKYNFYSVLSKNKNTIYQGIILTYPNNNLFGDLIEMFIKTPQSYINKRYLIFTRQMYDILCNHSNQTKMNYGENNNGIYLYVENCENQICYDGKDRYGYCCFIYDNDQKVFKTRYSDFPWN